MTERALLAKWRDALRDSDLDPVAKTVGFTISTYWNGRGLSAFPSKETIAKGAGLRSVRAADRAVLRLERAGFLNVSRSRGRSSNTYTASTPNPTPHGETGLTPHDGTGLNGSNPVSGDHQPRTELHATPSPGTGESAESAMNAYSARADARTKKKTAHASRADNFEGYDRGC